MMMKMMMMMMKMMMMMMMMMICVWQAELDRFQDTVRLLKDYYKGMDGQIPDELNPSYDRIPLIEVSRHHYFKPYRCSEFILLVIVLLFCMFLLLVFCLQSVQTLQMLWVYSAGHCVVDLHVFVVGLLFTIISNLTDPMSLFCWSLCCCFACFFVLLLLVFCLQSEKLKKNCQGLVLGFDVCIRFFFLNMVLFMLCIYIQKVHCILGNEHHQYMYTLFKH